MERLSASEVRQALGSVEGWVRRAARIERDFVFPDFPAAMRFVQRVGRASEQACHHPDIDIRWNHVRLSLTTHDAGGLTERDFVLAARFNALASNGRSRSAR